MSKSKSDPKVKKTLVRNYEHKMRPTQSCQVVHEVQESSPQELTKMPSYSYLAKENELTRPTLCSSEALANYLSDIKKAVPPPLSSEDLNIDRGKLCAEMTKKLNHHFNDHIYKNLIELNTSINDLKVSKKDKRPVSNISLKKDLEPNIEDFCKDDKECDSPPDIPVIKPKFKPVRNIEDGSLHKLVASFEVL